MFQEHFVKARMNAIGVAYQHAPSFQASAIPSWRALAETSRNWASKVRRAITVLETSESEPYFDATTMLDDISKRKTLVVSTANCNHPLWTQRENVDFRIVHDFYGHHAAQSDFSWEGEVSACFEHARELPNECLPALFTECIGQVARRYVYGSFGEQKICLLDF